MTKDQWIEAAYQHFCKRLGAPKDTNEEKNLRECAANIAEVDGDFNPIEELTPQEAVDEEISAGL